MPTYLMLNQWTATGVEHVKRGPERLEKAKEMAEKMGCKVTDFYLLMGGNYDTVVLVEAPSDAAMAKYAIGIGMLGNVRTQTMRAFNANEYEELVRAL
jgi:uncharacterized protein with GYD domain